MAREREVKVTILGDSSSGERALSALGDTSESAGSKLDAFGEKFGPKMVAAGAAAGAAGIYLTKLADEGKIATAQLRTSIENAGGSYDELAPRIGKVSDRLIKLGFDDEATARSLATLTTATQDPAKALDAMSLAADIAASRHISLESASDKLAKAYSGNTKVFKEFGINLSASATEQERAAAIAELTARVHGQAAAQADNFSTKMESLKIRAENVAEAIGAKVGPALTIAGPLMAGLGGILQSGLIPSLISGVAAAWTFASGMVASGLSAAAAAIPILIAWAPVILTIAAIGVAAYLLYDNWSAVWGFIQDVTGAAWAWIKDHLELIAMIVLAPVAPLILLVTHFDEAWSFVKDIVGSAWDWLRDTVSGGVSDVVGFVADLPGLAIDALSNLGGMLSDLGGSAMGWLADSIMAGGENVIGFYLGLPGRILDALGNLGDLLWDAGAAVMRGFLNGLKAIWGEVTSFVSGVGSWIANHKGPIEYDRRLLVPAGRAIMSGLVTGLHDGRTMLAGELAGTTGMIAGGTGGSSGRSGGVVINVAGSVVTERQLVHAVQAGLLQKQRRVPTLGLT